MKGATFFLMLLVLLGGLITAQDQQQEMTEEQKAWMEYMTPGDAHKGLEKIVGEWNVKTTFWMYPGAEPNIDEGKVVNKMIFEGRYLSMKQTGMSFGMPFEGRGIMGYDNGKKEYFSTWIDNMGTGLSISKGSYNSENNSIEMTGSMYNPMLKKDLEYRVVFNLVSENSYNLEMFMPGPDGNEYRNFIMEYTK